MGLRFRKRIRIAPGLWVNLSKGGVSLSEKIGSVTFNLGKKGVSGNVSVPGTGLSWWQRLWKW